MNKNRTHYFLYGSIILFLFLCFCGTGRPQEKSLKKITYEQAYQDAEPRLLKSLPSIRNWLDDEHYLLSESDEETKSAKLYKVGAKTGEKTLFIDYDQVQKMFPKDLRASEHIGFTKGYSSLLYSFENDLYYYSVESKRLKRLTATPEEEKNPRFSPNGKYVAFTRKHNLYVLNVESRVEYQLTSDGSDTIYNGWASWVYYEEILGRGSRYKAFWWSPDSSRIAFLRFDDSPVPTFPLFRARGTHGELEIERYPKAGDTNPQVRLGTITVPRGKVVWADINEKADHYTAWPFWFADSSKLTFQWMNRGQNNIKIYLGRIFRGSVFLQGWKWLPPPKRRQWLEPSLLL
jgi:dipeptidyl-peptidase-4